MYSIIILTVLGIIGMLGDMLPLKRLFLPVTLLGFALAWLGYFFEFPMHTSLFSFDLISMCFGGVMLVITGISVITVYGYGSFKHGSEPPYTVLALMIFATAGGLLMVAWSHLMMLFLAIEILSIPLYVLVGSQGDRKASQEASLKYFLLGAVASCIFLFGMALYYAGTGSFLLGAVHPHSLVGSAGVLLMIAGVCFKAGVVPFHSWVPDVYEGAPTVITGWMAALVKVAAFGALTKMVGSLSYSVWGLEVMGMAVLTMTLGNVLAVQQGSLKRLLAYSGIAHAGYMLLVFLPVTETSITTVFFYGASYALGTLGVFTVIHILEQSGLSATVDALRGLFKRNKTVTLLWCLSVLSLAGIPPLPGFFAKLLVLMHVVKAHHSGLLWVTFLNFLVGVYYYFRLILYPFTGGLSEESVVLSVWQKVGVVILLILTWGAVLFPEFLLSVF